LRGGGTATFYCIGADFFLRFGEGRLLTFNSPIIIVTIAIPVSTTGKSLPYSAVAFCPSQMNFHASSLVNFTLRGVFVILFILDTQLDITFS